MPSRNLLAITLPLSPHLYDTVDKPKTTTRLGLTFKNHAAAKVVVTDVGHGCAASGLLVNGDKLLSINGTRVTDEVQGRALAKAAVGEVAFSVQRGYAHVTVTGARDLIILTQPYPSPSPPPPPPLSPSPSPPPQSPNLKPPRGWESPSRTSTRMAATLARSADRRRCTGTWS